MGKDILKIIPVIPSADIARDIAWYKAKTGFEPIFWDNLYAVLYRGDIGIHLQWHADTPDDPLNGGSVIRLQVKNIMHFVEEFVQRGTITQDALRINTPWQTDEFGFYDLNHNAIFILEDKMKI